ncbi:hypothetical protein B0W47_07780 [Komagataeibacter nataicola]|uniref:Uncharacterized protein n=1 Tax=Komagataeibacter nataicola TaxID=265960 RepID=A0A9N7H0L7_9PROT|nr:hypothetical protein [Komagataeibacter nataicola]AQU87389.1 hypothetical protein B0W47_07780 [Komagataeibacter nataicola]PYD65274.1 hypothetical protein CDI09_14540 [Komagataeibacter nataicola]WNM09408.1 hypothetical protein RI056_05490 [Komagataeibacter nataicola]GBR18631.1 hypothetical protein AA0616_1342 [Komagataeibacter nataicola NRIC 0616]
MRLCDLELAEKMRERYRKAVKAFEEAAEYPNGFFTIGSHFHHAPDIAKLSGAELTPLLGRQAAEIAIELIGLGINMDNEVSEHLVPYVMAARDAAVEAAKGGSKEQ